MIWGDDESNDVFVDTHNVKTPDRWWKLIYRGDTNTYIAWVFNNDQNEKKAVMKDRIKTIEQLHNLLEFVPEDLYILMRSVAQSEGESLSPLL